MVIAEHAEAAIVLPEPEYEGRVPLERVLNTR